MNRAMKITIVVVLIVVIGVVFAIKQQSKNSVSGPAVAKSSNTNTAAESTIKNAENTANTGKPANLPRLVDLGASKCIPCKMMAPILDQIKEDYAGRLEVEVIDISKNPNQAGKYAIRIIPTQIFFDASGKELFRHEGFFSGEDILKKWKELGVDLEAEVK